MKQNRSIPSQATSPISVIGPHVAERMSGAYAKHQSLSPDVTEELLYILLLAIIEELTYRFRPKNNSQISSSIQSISNLTALLEDLLELWIKVRTGQPLVLNGESVHEPMELEQPKGFLCMNLLYRLVLRVWLTLTQNTLSCLATSPSIADFQALLPRPIAMVTDASLSLNKDWLFLGNRYLDNEFSFTFLESLYASAAAINTFISNPSVLAESFLKVLKSSLSNESQELLIYLCSKLQSLPRSSNSSLSDSVTNSIHLLLCQFTREMITLSDHIHTSQQTAKSQLLQQQNDSASQSSNYSLERAMDFDKLEQRLCKISQSLLSIFDNVPNIQLLSLQLLAQTGLDKVGIIKDFLPRVSHSSVWSMPEVLDLYLELLEKAWFQLSPEYAGSVEFWSKVSHYSTPLIQGSMETILQVTYHLMFLSSHQSNYLKAALTQHMLIQYHQKIIGDFQKKVYAKNSFSPDQSKTPIYEIDFSIEEEKMYHQYLKLLQKMAAHPSSLVPFIEDPQHIFLLFLFLPVPQFRPDALAVFRSALTTLSTPWAVSIVHTNKLANNHVHYYLVNSLLRIAYEFKEGCIVQQCQQMSTGGMSVGCLDIRQVDGVHRIIQACLEHSKISFLSSVPVIQHLQLVADVWEVLALTTETCSSLLRIMSNNQIWDVIQVLSPSLASLLERLQSWKTSESNELEAVDPNMLSILQETSVSLLCHLLGTAMTMCRLKEDPLKVTLTSIQHVFAIFF